MKVLGIEINILELICFLLSDTGYEVHISVLDVELRLKVVPDHLASDLSCIHDHILVFILVSH